MSAAAFKLQQRRRDQERILHGTQSFLSQHHNTEIRHDWEERTQKQIEQREVCAIAEKLLQQDEEELRQRKQELSSLYDGEMSHWRQTLQSSLETSQEQRMEKIRSRAYELKRQREAERQAFVASCYEKQWRDSCDDLRAYDSKATLDRIVKDREIMIQQKREMEATNKQQDETNISAMSLINKDESEEQAKRRQANLELKNALDHQVKWKRMQSEAITRQTKLEEKERLHEILNTERNAIDSAKDDRARRKEGNELLQETINRAKAKEARRNLERAQNYNLLQHALQTEQRQIQAEQAKMECGKNAASEYVQCLREQKCQEDKENEHINNIRSRELERLAKINDDKMAAKEELQRRWIGEIDASRRAQIQKKRSEAEAYHKEMDRDARELKASLQKADEADKLDAEKAQASRIENMLANKATMEMRAKEREHEKQEKYLLRQKVQEEQKCYQKRLDIQRKRCEVGDLI